MPELRHMENALLGESPEEIADLIALALKDEALRRIIGEGGRATYEAFFRPEVVVPKLLDRMQLACQSTSSAKEPPVSI
jgi:glycosyltransferase involved in cell wall biosynthesis